jgi:hypothetical protein
LPASRNARSPIVAVSVIKTIQKWEYWPLLHLLDSGRPAKANLSLDAGLLEAIDEAARSHGLTRSAFITSAAREKIGGGQALSLMAFSRREVTPKSHITAGTGRKSAKRQRK